MHIDENVRAGMTPEEARYAALRAFGGVDQTKEQCRDARTLPFLESIVQDLRFALRQLRKSPGFTTVAVLTLALGIGANTAIFSLLNAVLLRPLGVRNPHEIVTIWTSDFSGPPFGGSSYPDVVDFGKSSTDVLSGIAASSPPNAYSYRNGETGEIVYAEAVSPDYFRILDSPAALGRTLLPDEAAPAAVVSDSFWKRRLGAAADVIGRTIVINETPLTIVGVMPERFRSPWRIVNTDVWLPLPVLPEQLFAAADQSRGNRSLLVIGRLKPGVTASQAQTSFNLIAQQLHAAYPEFWTDRMQKGRRITVQSESQSRVLPQFRSAVPIGIVLMGVAGLVLLICCANIASLLLTRATSRRREMAVRTALGAARGRLVRQGLVENLSLALAGGVAGLFIAAWATGLFRFFKPPGPVPIEIDLRFDWRVMLFAIAVSVVTAILIGIAPVLATTHRDVLAFLKESPQLFASGKRRISARAALVLMQVGASVILLVGSGLFLRSLRNSYHADLGFRPDGIATATFSLRLAGYDQPRGLAAVEELVERTRAIPGVDQAAVARLVVLGLEQGRRTVQPEGYTPRPNEDMEVRFNVVGPGYFRLLGIPIALGREFMDADREGTLPVALVNEAFARQYWPGQNPIGKHVGRGPNAPPVEVIGVAKDARYISLAGNPEPVLFQSLLQNFPIANLTLHAHTTSDARALVAALRRTIAEVNPSIPILSAMTLDERVTEVFAPTRVLSTALGSFGLVAVGLAAVGLYGVLAFTVSRRTREIGIRMALGAEPGGIVRMVVWQGMKLALIGVAIGLGAALALTRLIRNLLYGVSPTDPFTYVVVSIVLIGVAALASYIPARRAARIDPMQALRAE
jgi:predicted permease